MFPPDPLQVAILYHEMDRKYFELLVTHLKPLHRSRAVDLWHTDLLSPGVAIDAETARRVTGARLVMLLLSADFVERWANPLTAMVRAKPDVRDKFVPVHVRACDLTDLPFEGRQGLPRGNVPLSSASVLDDAVAAIASEIRALVQHLRGGSRLDIPTILRKTIVETHVAQEREIVALQRQERSANPTISTPASSALGSDSSPGTGPTRSKPNALPRKLKSASALPQALVDELRTTLSTALRRDLRNTTQQELISAAIRVIRRTYVDSFPSAGSGTEMGTAVNDTSTFVSLEGILARDPYDVDALGRLSDLYIRTNQHLRAYYTLKRLVHLLPLTASPQLATVHQQFAEVYRILGNPRAAYAAAYTAHLLSPDLPSVAYCYGRFLMEFAQEATGRERGSLLAKAQGVFDRLSGKGMNSLDSISRAHIWYWRSRIALHQEDKHMARALVNRALALHDLDVARALKEQLETP